MPRKLRQALRNGIKLIIKSANNFNIKSRAFSFGYLIGSVAFFWICSLFIESSDFSNAIVGLGFLVGVLTSIRSKLQLNESFSCKNCSLKIDSKLENSGADNEAIIYFCPDCDILWHTGNTCN